MNNNRPLSPHLTIYKPQMTSMGSIAHRATGAGLSLAILGLVALLKLFSMNASSPFIYQVYDYIISLPNILTTSVLVLVLASLYYHFFNGVRHTMWDLGKNLELKDIYTSAYIIIGLTVVATIGTVIIFFL